MCGRIICYQISTPDAFHGSSQSIDTYYLDGVSGRMVLPANTSGVLQVVLMKGTLFTLLPHVPVLLVAQIEIGPFSQKPKLLVSG